MTEEMMKIKGGKEIREALREAAEADDLWSAVEHVIKEKIKKKKQ